MISEYLQSIPGVQIGGLAGLFISIALFLGVVIRTVRTDPRHIDRMAHLPLDQPESPEEHTQKDHP